MLENLNKQWMDNYEISYSKYKIEGDKVTRERFCPRCGPGIFLMKAKDRINCGKCHYTEFFGEEKKSEEAQ